jgi:prepilin-type N-terminal cleavage/methylation domain-containing protein
MTNIHWGSRIRRAAGFTAIELMMTMGLMSILGSMAAFQVGNARPALKGDGAMRVVMAQLNTARELAITQRRFIALTFTDPNVVNTIRQEIPNGTTTLSSVPIEGGIQFSLMYYVPDTPDAFGNSSPIAFGSATTIRFGSDGSFVDQSGNPVNGTVFLALPNIPRSFRAVTVMGATGRVRGYKWDGARWVMV